MCAAAVAACCAGMETGAAHEHDWDWGRGAPPREMAPIVADGPLRRAPPGVAGCRIVSPSEKREGHLTQ